MPPLLLYTFVFVASVAGIVLLAQAMSFIWRRVFLAVARRTQADFDEMLITATEKPVKRLIIILGLNAATDIYLKGFAQLLPETFWHERLQAFIDADIPDKIFSVLTILVFASLIHVIVRTLLGWYMRHMSNDPKETALAESLPLFDKLSGTIIYFIALTMILPVLGKDISGLLATAGVASLAVAFAAQETLANLISGFSILVDKPFRPGDRIELADGLTGDVVDIGLRTTRILSFDNTLIIIPNTQISGARIINHSYPDDKVKIRPRVTVSYDTDIDRAKELLYRVCKNHPKVLTEPEPAVYFTEFGDSALHLTAICWIADYKDRFQTLDEINIEIKKGFDRERIEIPYPQRVVHLHTD